MRRVSIKNTTQRVDPFMKVYLKEISKIPLLTAQEEKELGRRIQSGDLMARQKLIEGNLRFVIKTASKFTRSPNHLMDLVNAGNIGLIEAARRFNPELNIRFTTYAVWWIRQAIFHHLSQMTHAFAVSPKVANILYRTARVLNRESLVSGRVPNRIQLAEKAGVTVKELNSALGAIAGTVSLDQPVDEEGDMLVIDLFEQTSELSPEQQAVIQRTRRSLEDSIKRLSPVEQKVIRLRFGFNEESPLTLQQVGERVNLSRERIRQIEKGALRKLQHLYSTQSLACYLN